MRAVDAIYEYGGNRKRPSHTIGPVSLTVEAGERVALVGGNGSGKSTLLHLLSGASTPVVGCIEWFGESDIRLVRQRIGVVFQSPALDALLSIRETLLLAGRTLRMCRRAIASRVDELCELLSIGDRLDDRVGTLSGGLTRRVDLARAILHRPDLLLLDEATASLDQHSAEDFNAALDRLSGEGVTVVAATHSLDEAGLADRVIAMKDGLIDFDHRTDQSNGWRDVSHETGSLTIVDPDAATVSRLRDLGVSQSAGVNWRVEPGQLDDSTLGLLVREMSSQDVVLQRDDGAVSTKDASASTVERLQRGELS
ncbi:MAG: ABC transporter ATP-binding protein [Planctomycetota bacterium]